MQVRKVCKRCFFQFMLLFAVGYGISSNCIARWAWIEQAVSDFGEKVDRRKGRPFQRYSNLVKHCEG